MESIYELKKDINIPGRYIRAGEQKTRGQWEKIFPFAFMGNDSWEWFIDISISHMAQLNEEKIQNKIINEVFENRGLHSISYKEATLEVLNKYASHLTGS